MRYLESLLLILKCTNYYKNNGLDAPCILGWTSDNKEGREAMAIAIRQVLINAAVNETLAKSIFQL